MKDQTSANSLATVMGSLSDPVRLRMLRLLDQHELSVGEIAKVFQMAQSTASRQLKVLSDAAWLAKRSEGTASFYKLIAADLPATARSLWESLKPQLAPNAGHEEDDRRVRGVLEERKTDSVNFFGRVRGEWDQMRAELFGGRFTSAALLSLIRPDWVVADIGCGTGNVAELLSPVVERVVAVDQSEPMLSAARQRLGSRKNLDFIRASIGELPIESKTVDAAVCMLVLHHIEDVVGGLAEIARVLRASRGGGVLAVVDMVAHSRDEYRHTMGHRHQGFTKKQMLGLLEKAGFSHTLYYELPAEPDARGPGLFVANGRIR
ncbi:MAG: metalloregulator ArsR/SmtB family transcription factor [Planctomycetota bacterium]|nr:metalloregulator ArsR/SmtB family transcription factor [Planctomycetota bacterium]